MRRSATVHPLLPGQSVVLVRFEGGSHRERARQAADFRYMLAELGYRFGEWSPEWWRFYEFEVCVEQGAEWEGGSYRGVDVTVEQLMLEARER
jgi:hypothetical protein